VFTEGDIAKGIPATTIVLDIGKQHRKAYLERRENGRGMQKE